MNKGRMLPAALLLFIAAGLAHAAAGDTAKAAQADSAPAPQRSAAKKDSAALEDSLAHEKKLYEYISNPALQLLTWPADVVFVPLVKAAVYPFKAPLRYFLNENVIDRTIQLISFGSEKKIMLYPTMNLGPGTGSTVGFTLRDQALIGRPTETLALRGNIYVNGDWKLRSYINATRIAGTDFDSKFAAQLVRVKNSSFNQPGTNEFVYYSDSTNIFSLGIGHPIFGAFAGRLTYYFRGNHFGESPSQQDPLSSDFFRAGVPEAQGNPDSVRIYLRSRGLDQTFVDNILSLGISRDTRNNENITLSGSNFNLGWDYHSTQVGHDFHRWEGEWTGYYKLGKEQYEISAAEENKAGRMNIKKILEKMEYQKLRQELFNRKVVALHAYATQSYEVPGNRMPAYGLNTLGNDTPMRGYSGNRFRGYTVFSVGGEYRFPVMRLVDGVIFNEYGVYGRNWDEIDYLGDLKNSWGFGIHIRRPDIQLARVELGFHGAQGIEFNMSVETVY
jgi:hypothetical protein